MALNSEQAFPLSHFSLANRKATMLSQAKRRRNAYQARRKTGIRLAKEMLPNISLPLRENQR